MIGQTKSILESFPMQYFKEKIQYLGIAYMVRICMIIIFDYAKQFWEGYPNNRKLFRSHFSDANENTGELVRYMDDDLLEFLEYFYSHGHLDDTDLIILSGHGSHNRIFKAFWLPDNSRNIENTYPIMINLVKKDIPQFTLSISEI